MRECHSRTHHLLRGVLLLLGIVITIFGISACHTADGPIRITATPETLVPTRVVTPTITPIPSPTPDPLIAAAERVPSSAIGPLAYPQDTNPLTGLPVSAAALNRRPLAAKISNAPDSVRPQAGIGQADLVFEHYVEGGLTRFTAIYWSNTPPRLGSIRSARLIDLELPAMYGALFAYSGANAIIQQRITEQPFAARAFEGVNTGEPLYFRDPGIEMPHNLFIVPAEVWARAESAGVNDPPDLQGMVFDPTPPTGDQTATRITIDYGPDRIEWRYDAEKRVYRRGVDGIPHYDANTDIVVTAANVVVLYVPHVDDEEIVAGTWNGEEYYHFSVGFRGSGTAVICRDGQRIQGTWMRLNTNGPLTFWTDDSATEMIPLKPGNTWFEVVPADFTRAGVE